MHALTQPRVLTICATLVLTACGGSSKRSWQDRARERSSAMRTESMSACAGPGEALSRYDHCMEPAQRERVSDYKQHLATEAATRQGLLAACDLERGELRGKVVSPRPSACTLAVIHGVLPQDRAREILLPICQQALSSLRDINVGDLQDEVHQTAEAGCNYLLKHRLLEPEAHASVSRMACQRGALQVCDALAGDVGSFRTDADRAWAFERVTTHAAALCSAGDRGGCALLQRWEPVRPDLAQVRAQGLAVAAAKDNERAEAAAEYARQQAAEDREERRQERAERRAREEERDARRAADQQAAFDSAHSGMRQQQEFRNQQNAQARELMQNARPARPAPAPQAAPAPRPRSGSPDISVGGASYPPPPPPPPPPRARAARPSQPVVDPNKCPAGTMRVCGTGPCVAISSIKPGGVCAAR